MLKLVKSFTVFFIFFCTHLIAGTAVAGSIGIEGSLPRDLGTGKFQMTVTITGVTTTQRDNGNKDAGDALAQFKARFKIYLADESTPVPFAADGTSTVLFYAREYQDHTQDPDGNGFKYTYYIEIVESTVGKLKEKAASGKMNVKIEFLLGGESVATMPNSKTLEQDSFVINKAPDFDATAPIVGSHKSLTIKWNTETEVDALAGTTPVKKAPSQVLVFLIDSELVTQATLNAKKYSGTTAADTTATCQLALTADVQQNCITCDEGVYLLEEKQSGISFKTAAAKDGTVSFSNLENDRKYYAVLQYEPDGIKRSQCLAGVPSRNYSLTELNGADEATIVDFRCFIATAAYGSPAHGNLKFFRKFRDEILLPTAAGQALVDFYYTWSPPAADYIAARPWLRRIVRTMLQMPLTVLQITDDWY